MKKLFCIFLIFISCLSFTIAEEDNLSYEEWKDKYLSDYIEKENQLSKINSLSLKPGMKFYLLKINDDYYAGSQGDFYTNYSIDPHSLAWCEIVEIKPEANNYYKIVFTEVKQLEHDYELHFIDHTDSTSLKSLEFQYKTIYVTTNDKITIYYDDSYLVTCNDNQTYWISGYLLKCVEGIVSKSTYNKIILTKTSCTVKYTDSLDPDEGEIDF